MASPIIAGQRRAAAVETIQQIAADLSSQFNIENPFINVDYGNQHLENIDRAGSALF